MVFSSISAYLDPSNWQQQVGYSIPNPQLPSAPSQPTPPRPLASSTTPPPPLEPHHVGGSGGSIRSGSMADRARLANIPTSETAQKCPRCESTNTKFCYFNNYSLSQPRHFCKTCRRYWTRGGALRSIPVGGGCRRNKRNSTSSGSTATSAKSSHNNSISKSQASSQATNSGSTSNNNSTFSSPSSATSLLGLMNPQIHPLRFMSPLGQLTDQHFTLNDNATMNYSSISSSSPAPLALGTNENMNFQLGMDSNLEQWPLHQQPANQFPYNLYGGLASSSASTFVSGSGIYPFHPAHYTNNDAGGGRGVMISQIRPKVANPMLTQLALMKMEDNQDNVASMPRQFLGNENWLSNGGSANWNELSASFSSSSTSNVL